MPRRKRKRKRRGMGKRDIYLAAGFLSFVQGSAKLLANFRQSRQTNNLLIDESENIIGSDSSGHIYILVNPSLPPTMLKIGATSRAPEKRARELSRGTGVPTDYVVAYDEYVSDWKLAEQAVHNRLDHRRVRGNREFFSIQLKEAISVVSEVAFEFREIGEEEK